MKLQGRKSASVSELKRNLRQADRGRAPSMRNAFPQLEQLRIELEFVDRAGRAPSPQSFILFPPAAAFFRFACPCSECDGEFDLSPVVSALVNATAGSKRVSSRTASNSLVCEGVHLRDHANSRPCSIAANIRLVASADQAA